MIIDCHGHYTTAPKALESWRKQQMFAVRIDKTLYDCEESSRFLPPDLHITVGMAFAIGVLARGGTVVFDKTFHADDIANTIRLYGVTHCLIAPAGISRFAAAIPARGIAFPSLRHLRIVGAMPSAGHRGAAVAVFAEHLRPLRPHRARRGVARHAGDARGRARIG